MKAKVLLIAAALLMFAASSFGQGGGCVAPLTYVPLTYGSSTLGDCASTGRTVLPDGTPIYLYHDIDSDGPDGTDPLVTLCSDPENACSAGPAGTWNANMFALNGEMVLGVPGAFYPETMLCNVAQDLAPNRLYVRVFYPNMAEWTTMYTSPWFPGGVQGAQIEYEITSWTCKDTLRQVIPPCTKTPLVSFTPNPGVPHEGGHLQIPPQYKCVTVCDGEATVISVGPVTNSPLHPRLPRVSITEGCNPCPGEDLCELTTNGAVNTMFLDAIPANWTIVNVAGLWYMQATVLGTADGCVCVMFDFILPVQMGNVTITPADNSAKLTWTTRSESNLARFEVVRDGEVIGVEAARNHTSDENYSYVDETAENGHIYTYELVAVGIDGSADVVFNGKVAPNAMYAKPTEYALGQNFPNPFNPTTTISFDIVDTNPVTLMVYNANGQLVTTLLNNVSKDAGRYSLNFDATNLTSGLYFYTVKVGNVYTATKKMLLVK